MLLPFARLGLGGAGRGCHRSTWEELVYFMAKVMSGGWECQEIPKGQYIGSISILAFNIAFNCIYKVINWMQMGFAILLIPGNLIEIRLKLRRKLWAAR
jgi:hypothetical protein